MWLVILLLVSVGFIVVSTARYQLHPFLALLLAAFGYGLGSGRLPLGEVVKAVNEGFGGTVGHIGIVILAGTIIGVFLERSGGALRLAESVVRITGPRRVPLGMGLLGYLVSIPVFCDAAFIILSPLNRALSARAGLAIAPGAIALSLGLYATHTMVPPTPGPVGAAGILEADLGRVAVYGLLAAGVALAAGILFAIRFAAGTQTAGPEQDGAGHAVAKDTAPGTLAAVLPIVVPIILIVLRSAAGVWVEGAKGPLVQGIDFLGQPAVALAVGVALACRLPRRWDRQLLSGKGWAGEAVSAAAAILVITASGGAFGKVLQAAGIGAVVESLLQGAQIGLFLPFLLAAALKTAQGSSTVAIITTAGIVAPLLGTLGLDSADGRALAVVAIGAGSMVVSHANDSYFWVVTQFSGLSVRDGYRLQTVGTLVQGLGAAAALSTMAFLIL